jgi:6-phospho-3-hexuloisomerase
MMCVNNKLNSIIEELKNAFINIDEDKANKIVNCIISADRIFITGQGRTGIMAKAFAMRLMHLGLKCFIVGETLTPSIQSGDLLIAGSGSGESRITCYIANSAREKGAHICSITTNKDSELAKLSDVYVTIADRGKTNTCQFGGSLFEQSLLIYFDSIIILIIEKLGMSYLDMKNMHANLE